MAYHRNDFREAKSTVGNLRLRSSAASNNQTPTLRPFEGLANELVSVFGDMHSAYRRKNPDGDADPESFARFVSKLPKAAAFNGWLWVLAYQIDDKHQWCSEHEMRVLVPLVQATGKMRAVRASIFYYLSDAVALKNGVKGWLRFLERTAQAQGDPLPDDLVGDWIKSFNRTVKAIEIGRNRLTHNPAHEWNDLGHFDAALASEIHRIGSPNERKPKDELVDDILTAFSTANRLLDVALSDVATAAHPYALRCAQNGQRVLREL